MNYLLYIFKIETFLAGNNPQLPAVSEYCPTPNIIRQRYPRHIGRGRTEYIPSGVTREKLNYLL